MISGNDCYSYLQHESGVHRVQRVPKTEKSGRIHTSTVTVAILPQPTEVNFFIVMLTTVKSVQFYYDLLMLKLY